MGQVLALASAEFEGLMGDLGNGSRPRASATTVATFILMVAAVLTLGGGAVMAVISITTAIADIRTDVALLKMQTSDMKTQTSDMKAQVQDMKSQVQDMKADVREVVGAVRKAEHP